MKNNVLDVRNLVTEFQTEDEIVKAVDNLSFTLGKGATIGIVGESGSGKSVTSLSIMRLIPSPPGKIKEGEILFQTKKGEVVDLMKVEEGKMRQYRGSSISMIFQEPMTSLNPVFSCGDQVAEAIIIHLGVGKKEARLQTIELFKKVNLPRPEAMYDAYPHQLSGGQKQRVMIAMAMACKPSVLIADEPTTALDVTVQFTILELMKELQKEQEMAIIFITHDLGIIAEIADFVLVMYKGKLVEQGKVEDLFKNPKHPYTKGLLACRPPLDRRLRKLPTIADFIYTRDDGTVVENPKTVAEVTQSLIITKDERDKAHQVLYKQEPILKVQNLKTYFPIKKGVFGKTRDWVKAVDDVSFEVYPGETMGLVGESGCGKTTLGRTILRLVEPTFGSVVYDGTDLTKLSQDKMRAFRKQMQIIFQDPYSSLNPRMTVGSAIMEPMSVHGIGKNKEERKAKAISLLEKVNMGATHFNRFPHEFSGGQRQRICIARALALNPKFIVCDESVSALDVSVQAQVLNLLNELKRDFGFTCIFISHDLSVVKFMSDRMIVMNQGKIEEMGDPDEIYLHPTSDYTRKLIDSIPARDVEHSRLRRKNNG